MKTSIFLAFLSITLSSLGQGTTIHYYDSKGKIVQSVTNQQEVKSPYSYEIPQRFVRSTPAHESLPARPSIGRVNAPIRISSNYTLSEPKEGMSYDYYRSFIQLRDYVLSMAKIGVDVTAPNLTEDKGGMPYQTYVQLETSLREQENLTPEKKIAAKRKEDAPKYEGLFFTVLHGAGFKVPYDLLGKTEFELNTFYSTKGKNVKASPLSIDGDKTYLEVWHEEIQPIIFLVSPETELTYAMLIPAPIDYGVSFIKVKENLENEKDVVFDRFGRSLIMMEEENRGHFILELLNQDGIPVVKIIPVTASGARMFFKK